MKVQYSSLNSDLLNNVCEVRFLKRTSPPGQLEYRRMLCTKNYQLLSSINGKLTLNFREATRQKVINEAVKNVLVVWDILMQDYRIISLDDCDLITKIPADETFWEYFNKNIYPMSTNQKVNFMKS
jgi:hypothetical protein